MAVAAGEDLLAICAGPENIKAGRDAILEAVASVDYREDRINKSLVRIGDLKSHFGPAAAFDTARLTDLTGQIQTLKNDIA